MYQSILSSTYVCYIIKYTNRNILISEINKFINYKYNIIIFFNNFDWSWNKRFILFLLIYINYITYSYISYLTVTV